MLFFFSFQFYLNPNEFFSFLYQNVELPSYPQLVFFCRLTPLDFFLWGNLWLKCLMCDVLCRSSFGFLFRKKAVRRERSLANGQKHRQSFTWSGNRKGQMGLIINNCFRRRLRGTAHRLFIADVGAAQQSLCCWMNNKPWILVLLGIATNDRFSKLTLDSAQLSLW